MLERIRPVLRISDGDVLTICYEEEGLAPRMFNMYFNIEGCGGVNNESLYDESLNVRILGTLSQVAQYVRSVFCMQ